MLLMRFDPFSDLAESLACILIRGEEVADDDLLWSQLRHDEAAVGENWRMVRCGWGNSEEVARFKRKDVVIVVLHGPA